MNLEQIVQRISKHVSWEVQQNKENNTVASLTIEDLVYSYASDVVNEEMDYDNPETAPLIESYVKPEDRTLYQQLQQLSGKLTFDQYSAYHRLRDDALRELGEAAGEIVLARYDSDYESNAPSGEALQSPELAPLHLAAMVHNVEAAQKLLETGHDPNTQNAKGDTCLHIILRDDDDKYQREGIEAMARLLLEKGAAVNARNARGQTPLHLAAVNDHQGATELLLAAGADIGAEDAEGHTPLKLAQDREAFLQDEDPTWADTAGESVDRAIYLLYAAEANLLYAAEAKRTYQLFLGAVENNDLASVEKMLKEEPIELLAETYPAPMMPLQIAAKHGHDEIVRLLLESGADIDAGLDETSSDTPLLLATKASTIRILLDADPIMPEFYDDFYEAKRNYSPPYSSSSFSGSILLDAGFSVEQRDHSGQTLLHAAVMEPDAEGIEALLAAGADVNARDKTNTTPFHWSGWCGENVIQTLLQAGADKEARNDQDRTPLLFSLEMIVMAQHGGGGQVSDSARCLLDAGVDFNVHDKDGNTPLHWISSMDEFDAELAERIIRLTTDVNAVNSKGETPLSIALAEENSRIAGLLLAAGATSATADGKAKQMGGG